MVLLLVFCMVILFLECRLLRKKLFFYSLFFWFRLSLVLRFFECELLCVEVKLNLFELF